MALNLWAFTAITVPLVATPGASTAVVLRNAVAGGTRAGLATAIGANAGSVCYGLLTAFGVSVVLQRWPMVWVALRIGGTAYLAYLGIRSLRGARTGTAPAALSAPSAPPVAAPPLARSASEGFITNVLNPSIATFYLAILPDFIPRGAPFAASALTLTAIHVALAITWHSTWAAAGGTLAAMLTRPRPRRTLDAISGIALLALALKLAL
ncbi:MAG TPA: LysE family translocator [Vicinamibacterales bacterium]|nr:LysE family translocator [Vicinamibacterales bacterium]